MGSEFLFQAIIYLTAAIFCVPIAKKLGMGSVLGYIMAGIIIGPYLLGFIGKEGQDIMHFAEFGVVMMLFLIGLELEPAKLWRMRKLISGVGLIQVLLTALVFFGLLLSIKLTWQQSIAISFSLALSSTAIVLQSLKEKNQMNTSAGQYSFAVLLMQDIAVIPLLAILPLLGAPNLEIDNQTSHNILHDLPSWAQTLGLIAAIALVIITGKYAISPLLRMVAQTRLRELFAASALLLVVAITFLMEMVGLSPALGAFLAGVVLANSEFKHELESDLEPFKGLLLGLFFIAVGASINFQLVANEFQLVLLFTLGIIAVKTLILFLIGKFSKLSFDQNLIFSLGLSQVGEFSFVTYSFTHQLKIIDQATNDLLMAITAISMTLTPIIMLICEKFILPKVGTKEKVEIESDKIDEKNSVIIAGFSHFGSTVGRFLRANGIEATILDHDSDRVDLLRKMGFKVYYGDATRLDLLISAGAENAKIFISAIDDSDTNLELVETMKKHFPHLKLFMRVKNRFFAYQMFEQNVQNIYRESFDTSVRLGKDVLIELGLRAHSVHRAAQNFSLYDEASLKDLSVYKNNQKEYISEVRKQIEIQEALLNADNKKNFSVNDHAWDSELLKQGIGQAKKQ